MKLHDDADGVVSTVFLSYEDPDTGEINEISRQFQRNELVSQFLLASPKFQLSTVVAEYAEILRESYWARESSLQTVANEAARLRRLVPEDTDIAEFASLTAKAEQLWTTAGR